MVRYVLSAHLKDQWVTATFRENRRDFPSPSVPFSRVSAVSIWDSNVLGFKSDGRWKSMSTADESLPNTGPRLPGMETFEPFANWSPSMLFVEASPARTSRTPESEKASTATAPDCGPRWPGSLAWFDHSTSSWRTYQRCF